MTEFLDQVIEHFPEREQEIRELSASSSHFETLCRQYGELAVKLHKLSSGGEPGREAGELRRRRADLETELLAMMQQTARA